MSEKNAIGRAGRVRIGLAALAGVALAGAIVSCSGEQEAEQADTASVVATTPRSPGITGWKLPANGVLAIRSDELPARGLVPLDLELTGAPGDSQTLSGRIRSTDEAREDGERPLHGRVIGTDRQTARVGVASNFLTPGGYELELTGDAGAGSLPRYKLEVR